MVEVPPALIKRQKQHFTALEGTGTLLTYTYSAACEERNNMKVDIVRHHREEPVHSERQLG